MADVAAAPALVAASDAFVLAVLANPEADVADVPASVALVVAVEADPAAEVALLAAAVALLAARFLASTARPRAVSAAA